MIRLVSIPFIVLLFLGSCRTWYQAQRVTYHDYRIASGIKRDSGMILLLKPYSDSVNRSMNDIIAWTDAPLEKKQPEGTLGNMMADAMLSEARALYQQPVDAAFINYGGIRLNSLAAGSITRGKIFELSPFDNIIVLLKIKGSLLQTLVNHVSERGGWPVAGIGWKISDKKARDIKINNVPLHSDSSYTIALVDYVANGGDDCGMLKPVPKINGGYLYRDALIHYLGQINQQGKRLNYTTENRIGYVD